MSLNATSTFRIGALLGIAGICAWGGAQYSDGRAFERRNAGAMAICGS